MNQSCIYKTLLSKLRLLPIDNVPWCFPQRWNRKNYDRLWLLCFLVSLPNCIGSTEETLKGEATREKPTRYTICVTLKQAASQTKL